MDLDHPWALFSSLLIGLIGMGIFLYGKKQVSPRCLLVGAGLCVFPYFVTSVALMWTIATASLAGLYFTRSQ